MLRNNYEPKDLQVIKANSLVKAHSPLSLHELRVIGTVLSTIYQKDCDIKEFYQVDVDKYMQSFNLSREKAVSNIKEGAKNLLKAVVKLPPTDIQTEYIQWVSKVVIKKGNSDVYIQFHEDIHPFLFELQKYFTIYQLEDLRWFKTPSSIKFYEYCRCIAYLQEVKISIEEFRDILDMYKYPKTCNFKSQFIDSVVKTINTKTNLRVKVNLWGLTARSTHVIIRVRKV